jgi:hypothetical protein
MKRPASPLPLARKLARACLTVPLAAGALGAEAAPATTESSPVPAGEKAETETKPAEAVAAEKTDSGQGTAQAPGALKNWVEFGVGGTFFNGRRAAYQQRTDLPDGAFGGIEGFHFEQGVGEEGRFQVDGRGIFDNHDYALRFDLTLPEKGFFRAGYREYRHWSDPAGGWFPPTQGWYDLVLGRARLR